MLANNINEISSQNYNPGWNTFQNIPIKKNVGSTKKTKWLGFLIKLSKISAYLVTFFMILGTAVVSKGTLLFMTSQIAPNRSLPYCNKNLGVHREFVVTLPLIERLAWIWMIIFSYFAVELLTFLRSLRICLFKSWTMPTKPEVIFLFFTESLPTVGSAILVFCILPELDVLKGVMLTNAVCFVPALGGLFASNSESEHTSSSLLNIAERKSKQRMQRYFNKILNVICILAQATAFVVWPIMDNKPSLWLIPLAIILISFGWLENYISKEDVHKLLERFNVSKENKGAIKGFISQFNNSRYFAYLFISLWKCALFFITTVIIVWIQEQEALFLIKDFANAFKVHYINVKEIKPIVSTLTNYNIEEVIQIGGSVPIPVDYLTPVWVFIINVGATFMCYAFGKFACKIQIQAFSYAFPINLTVPVAITLLIIFCGLHSENPCAFHKTIPPYLFFNGPPIYDVWDFIGNQQSWIWLLWLLSQTWITLHIWSANCEKLAKTEKLYVKPMYDPFLIDQSIAMNRRREDQVASTSDENNDDNGTTMIYACACMWHETKDEMKGLLRSIMRLDEDQFVREIVQRDLGYPRNDYYKLETHVFFDDAFIRVDVNDNDPSLNKYVEELIEAVPEAIAEEYPINMKLKHHIRYSTPYGGRLEWTLPGKTKLLVHLKDRKYIRNKKRWSQVMYMYYLLGFGIMGKTNNSPEDIEKLSNNTYILALDGDIDFQPNALHHLVTLMKRNSKLGAACGRIHPLGSGPMIWYQIFEFSVGHWLQKTTENILGCVLCSPGCFSLFRAKALMDTNVLAKYNSRAVEAIHFVQYDQGEDRWLCTLLLKRGYGVEFCAASDSYTQCPEKFFEFYNQRRRWMSSTTANILDLLIDYEHTIQMNDSISRLYMLYQTVLMVGTILGPGTIFLMLVGSFVAAFQMSQWSSFCWNAFPIILYICVCYWGSRKLQLFLAGVLSAIYGLVMMAVLVGVMLQISVDGPLAPSSLFFFGVAVQLIITGVLHPKEMGNLVYGFVYYITIPSMYLLLAIYSIFNLNDISWGTRDVTVIPKKPAEEQKPQDQDGTKRNKVLNIFGSEEKQKKTGSVEFSCAGLFSCMLCPQPKQSEESVQLLQINDGVDKVAQRMDALENLFYQKPNETSVTTTVKTSDNKEVPCKPGPSSPSSTTLPQSTNSWMCAEVIGSHNIKDLDEDEDSFWKEMVSEKMLKPYADDEKKVAKDLKDLRDKSVMAFIMLNAIFVLIVFLLTLKKELIHIKWPFSPKVNFTYIDNTREIKIYKEYLTLEPIGFVFLFFFATILLVQFIAMLFHRFGTFSQILASTNINWNYFILSKLKPTIDSETLEKNAVKVVKKLMKKENVKELPVQRRKTVRNVAFTEMNDLESVFKNNLENYVSPKRKSLINVVTTRMKVVNPQHPFFVKKKKK